MPRAIRGAGQEYHCIPQLLHERGCPTHVPAEFVFTSDIIDWRHPALVLALVFQVPFPQAPISVSSGVPLPPGMRPHKQLQIIVGLGLGYVRAHTRAFWRCIGWATKHDAVPVFMCPEAYTSGVFYRPVPPFIALSTVNHGQETYDKQSPTVIYIYLNVTMFQI